MFKHGRTERTACNQSPDFSDGTSSGCQCGVSTPSYFSMVMKTHLMSHRSPLGQNEFNALAELDSVGISSRVFDSIDKPLISVHGSAQYRRQRAIDLVRHFRSSRLPVYSQWSLAHREMRPMYLPRKIDSVTKGSAIRENFERIQFNISSCDFLRLGV